MATVQLRPWREEKDGPGINVPLEKGNCTLVAREEESKTDLHMSRVTKREGGKKEKKVFFPVDASFPSAESSSEALNRSVRLYRAPGFDPKGEREGNSPSEKLELASSSAVHGLSVGGLEVSGWHDFWDVVSRQCPLPLWKLGSNGKMRLWASFEGKPFLFLRSPDRV